VLGNIWREEKNRKGNRQFFDESLDRIKKRKETIILHRTNRHEVPAIPFCKRSNIAPTLDEEE